MKDKTLLLEVIKERLTNLRDDLYLSNDEFIEKENKKYENDNIIFEKDEAYSIKTAVAKGVINAILYLMED